ncbi:MAG: hypothetical protein U0234_32905 [Sandaracinus sp.]
MGGPFPVPVPADLTPGAGKLHALVTGGSLRCPCGVHHDAPPRSDVVVRLRPLNAEADLYVTTTSGAERHVRVRGVVGEAEAHALARQVLTLVFGGLICDASPEALDDLTMAHELDLVVFRSDAAQARPRVIEWLRPHGVPGHARLCFAGSDHRLQDVLDVAAEATPFVRGALMFEVVAAVDVSEVSLLGPASAPVSATR